MSNIFYIFHENRAHIFFHFAALPQSVCSRLVFMRLSITRRYFWVAQTCVWLRVCACVKVQTDLTLTLTPPQGKGKDKGWGCSRGNATGKWKSKSKSTLQLQLQCEWTIAQCKCETRKLILRRVWRLSVCPSVRLAIRLPVSWAALSVYLLSTQLTSARRGEASLPCPALLRPGWLSKFGVSDCVYVWAECIITCAVSNANKTFAPAIKPCDDFALPSLLARTASNVVGSLNP